MANIKNLSSLIRTIIANFAINSSLMLFISFLFPANSYMLFIDFPPLTNANPFINISYQNTYATGKEGSYNLANLKVGKEVK